MFKARHFTTQYEACPILFFVGRRQYSSEIKEFLRKSRKENLAQYEITHFELAAKGFPIPYSLSFYMNSYAYLLVRRGKAQINISGYNYELGRNSIVALVPSHTIKFIEVDKNFKAIGLILTKDFSSIIPSMEKVFKHLNRSLKLFNQPIVCVSNKEFFVLLNSLLGVQFKIVDTNHLMQTELIQNTFITFLLEWINCFDKHTQNHSQKVLKSNHTEQLLNSFIILLREHFRTEHLVSFYANELCITTQYLTATVKKLTGKTVNQFIYDILYSEASIMLNQTDLSIQQIAEELHFSDASAFCKFFKRRSGISPLKFRNK